VVLLAMAGASALSRAELFARALRPLGVRAPVRFASDLLATFCTGTWRLTGYAVVAGTGAAAVRVEDGAVAAVSDGLGWLLGDDGSGFWIGRRVARAVVAELDRRGPATALTPLLLGELALVDDGVLDHGRPAVLQRLLEAVYALRPVEIARFASLPFSVAGDAVADAIIGGAAEALAQTFTAIADAAVNGPIVLGGGALSRHDALAAGIAAARPGVEMTRVADGTAGAAVMALRETSVAVDARVFATTTESLAALRGI
jgi:N-acetylglucosamine kinase-like BadF-type ATPase